MLLIQMTLHQPNQAGENNYSQFQETLHIHNVFSEFNGSINPNINKTKHRHKNTTPLKASNMQIHSSQSIQHAFSNVICTHVLSIP